MIQCELYSITGLTEMLITDDQQELIQMIKYWLWREYYKDLNVRSISNVKHISDYPRIKRLLSDIRGDFTGINYDVVDVGFIPNQSVNEIYIKYRKGI